MEYAIYQVKNTNPGGRMFMNADWLAKNGLKATKDAYDRVYSGEVESPEPLEYLWKKFNMAHPDDYRGRSLSVSDVVVLIDEEGAKAFFCDSIGWMKVPEFLIKREIRKNGIFSIHVCPNHCEALLTTSAHVAQTWKVDALGNFVDEVSNDDIVSGPDDGNIWECEECGAEAGAYSAQLDKESLEDALKQLENEYGMTICEIADKTEFMEAVAPLYDEYRNSIGQDIYDYNGK